MAKSDEDERRERLELLKMKQGLISESELIPEEQEKPAPPMTAGQKIANFFYYYKWVIIIGAAAIALLTYMIVQTVTRAKPDIKVLLIGMERGSGIPVRSEQVEPALEGFCSDFNGDGKIHVGVTAINLGAQQTDGQYYVTQMMLFDSELTGEGCIIISEKSFFDYMLEEVGASADVFLPIGGGYSVPVSETTLGGVLGNFPEDAYVYLLRAGRDEALVKNSETVLNALLSD